MQAYERPTLMVVGPKFMAMVRTYVEYGGRDRRRVKREIRKALARAKKEMA